jgi:hypothetical protein
MRILFTGNLFHGYEQDIKEGLEQGGHQVDMVFNNIHGPYHIQDIKTIPNWLKYGLLPYKLRIDYFTNRSVDRYNRKVQDLIRKNKYDLLLVIGAKTIFPETIKMFPGRKVFWFMDALPRYQFVMPKIPLFDDLFVFEPTDISYIKQHLNLDATFLTLAFNPKKYFKKQLPLQYDFSFVGSYYPKREQFLNSLLQVSGNICIYGDFHRAKNKEVRNKMKRITVPHSFANDLYNSSRININIHHQQSKEGLAIRTFEIIGAGGFQVVERQKAAVEMFEEYKNIVFYDSAEDLIDKCKYYLIHENARNNIAQAAGEEAIRNHTWKRRVEQLFIHLKIAVA